MSKDSFFRFFTGDFLNGIADLAGDEIGAYTVIIALMHDRGGPIPDEAKWIARRAGISTRRWQIIRAKLIKMKKIKARGGELANPRALRDIAKRMALSDTRRAAAYARWHSEDEPELALGDEIVNSGDNEIIPNKRRKTAESGDANASGAPPADPDDQIPKFLQKKGETIANPVRGINDQKPQISAKTDDAFASKDSRARAGTPYPYLESPSDRTLAPSPRARAHEAQPDLPDVNALLKRVQEAAGFFPANADHQAKAMEYVQAWADLGIDIPGLAIPIIERTLAAAPDKTTGSLARFDRDIRAEHAAAKAAVKHPTPPAATTLPAGPDTADPRLETIRHDLRRDCGARTYDGWLRPAQMSIDGTTLIVALPSQFMADWVLTNFANRFAAEAKRHGFTKVEIGLAQPKGKPP